VGGGNDNNAGSAIAVAAGLATRGTIIANTDNDNRPSSPSPPQYSGTTQHDWFDSLDWVKRLSQP
jgi:hypothetical protein